MQPYPVPDDIVLLVATVRRRVKQVVCGRLEAYDLGPQQFWVLLTLHEHDGMSAHQLAQKTWTDDPTMCRILARLGDRGLVRMSEHPDDRRRWRLHLTAKGRKLATQLDSLAREVRGGIHRGLTVKERRGLCDLLRRVIANAESLAKDAPEAEGPARRRRAS